MKMLRSLFCGLAITALAACSTAQVQSVQAALASPAAQALVAGLLNFDPSVQKIVASANAGVAATAADKQMVCGAMSWANGLFVLAAPLAGISASAQSTEAAAMVGVNTVCSSSTTDVPSAVSTVLNAYLQTTDALKSAGVTPAS